MISDELAPQAVSTALLARSGPGESGWLTRFHREVAREWPEAYVFRLGEPLRDLAEWLASVGCGGAASELHPWLVFDEDRDGPRSEPDGGCAAFCWEGCWYRIVSVSSAGRYRTRSYTWIGCPRRENAEALVDAVGRFARSRRRPVMVFEDGDWEAAPRLEADLSRYTWDSVVLPPALRARLEETATLFFRSEAVYRELGIPWKLGFLLVGPPGTGKTLVTKVLANSCRLPFLFVRGLETFDGRPPDSGTVRAMFQGVRERAPCLFCLEDLDSLVTDPLRATFLNELDGLEEDYRGVLTVATTNHPERIDAALLHRPSRFDHRFELPLPDAAQRRAFLEHWARRLETLGYLEAPGRRLEELVSRARGLSHAHLKRSVLAAVLRLHHAQERGTAAFQQHLLAELAAAQRERAVTYRTEAATDELAGAGRLGFRGD
jgi:hypothetical protein